jgi:hypothetical protein
VLRVEVADAHEVSATAEPSHISFEAQSWGAGLTLSTECGRQKVDEAQGRDATAEPGRKITEAHRTVAGLTLFPRVSRGDIASFSAEWNACRRSYR